MKKDTKALICGIIILCICVAAISFLTGRYIEAEAAYADFQVDNIDLEEAYNTYRPAHLNILTEGRVFDFSSIIEPDGSVINTTTISYQIRVINNDTKTAEGFCFSLADINADLKIWAFEIGVKYDSNMKIKLLYTSDGFMKTGSAYFGNIPSNGTIVVSIYITVFETEPGSFNDNLGYNMRINLIQEYPSLHMGGIMLNTKTEIISYTVRT